MLRVLLVEDSAADAELVEHQLRMERLAVHVKKVETRGELLGSLDASSWDVVLADFTMPQFGALEVLEILEGRKSDLPVILVTGTLSEELAIEFIKQGGEDFILKSSLKRLGSAIAQAIERKALEREKRRAQAALRESEERLRLALDGLQDYAICMLGPDGKVLAWNSGAERLFGYAANEIVGQHFSTLYQASRAAPGPPLRVHLPEAQTRGRFESEGWLARRGGPAFYAKIAITPLRDAGQHLRGFSHVVRDVTERRRAEEALKRSHAQMQSLAANLQSSRESETIRIAREIHDELGQGLTALKIELSRIAAKLSAQGEPLAARLQSTVDLTNATIQTLQRIVTGLRPRLLDELGLAEAIRWQVTEFQNHTGIRCRFSNREVSRSFPPEQSTALFRILQEALTNVARHARATRVLIDLRTTSGGPRLSIRDNGRGVQASELERAASLGILGMRERAQMLRGAFDIQGIAGKGTRLTVTLPFQA